MYSFQSYTHSSAGADDVIMQGFVVGTLRDALRLTLDTKASCALC